MAKRIPTLTTHSPVANSEQTPPAFGSVTIYNTKINKGLMLCTSVPFVCIYVLYDSLFRSLFKPLGNKVAADHQKHHKCRRRYQLVDVQQNI